MSDYEIALQVIDGAWGNNDDRKKALTDAGYNYEEIQRIVNDILTGKERIKEAEIDVRGYTGLKITLVVD